MIGTRSTRDGFTLLELVITISIILILISLLIPALAMVRRHGKEVQTRHTMQQLADAIAAYQHDWPLLGDVGGADSADFSTSPVRFLIQRMHLAGRMPLFDATDKLLAMNDGSSASDGDADTLFDGWHQPLTLHIVNGPWNVAASQREFTDLIEIRTSSGTPTDPSDDLLLRFSLTGDINPRDGIKDQGVVVQEWQWIKP